MKKKLNVYEIEFKLGFNTEFEQVIGKDEKDAIKRFHKIHSTEIVKVVLVGYFTPMSGVVIE